MRTNPFHVVVIAILGIVLGCTPPAAPAPATSASPGAKAPAGGAASGAFKIGASSPETTNLPVWLAIDQGIFSKLGLSVEYVSTGVGNTTVAALESGDIAAASLGPSNVAGAVAAGSDVRSVMGLDRHIPYFLIVAPNINAVEELRGQPVAIANPGGTASVMTEVVLNNYGLTSQDVTLINLGNPANRLQAVQSGQVQATLTTPTPADKLGAVKILQDLRDTDFPYAGSSLAMKKSFIQSNHAAAAALLKGTWEGLKMVLDPSKKPQVIQALKSRMELNDADAEYQYNEAGPKRFKGAQDPRVNVKGVEQILQVLSKSNQTIANVKADDVIDNSIIDRLAQEGYKW